jgi:polar amino acid transport system permease protein
MTRVAALTWDWKVITDNVDVLARGALVTFELAVISMALALVIGALLATLTEHGPRPVRWLSIGYVELMRAIPLLVLLFWLFLVLPLLVNITLTPFQTGVLGLTLSVSAFVAEGFRSGVAAVSDGQRQAGMALGLTQVQLIRRVIWPQAWRQTVPIVGSTWVGLFKDSALVSLIQIHDLMFEGRVIANQSFAYLEVFTALGVVYFLMSWPQAWLVDRIFDRFRVIE